MRSLLMHSKVYAYVVYVFNFQLILSFGTVIVLKLLDQDVFKTRAGGSAEVSYDGEDYLPSRSTLQMPVLTEPYVELYCDRPMAILMTPLIFNLVLLMLCCVFAFLTRKLPDGFNESWYIFLSVSTTLFIWIAFLPTYFLTFYAYHKEALLALALLLNALACIICLFAPKLYALFYLDDADITTSNFNETTDSTRVSPKKKTDI